ncbi:MAG: DUF87 domain-containing protein [Clostridiales bacterium]|nr:DUF87 domain-containing protein [Clostridiales bacterium]
MDTKLAEAQDVQKMTASLELAMNVITKDYLYQLADYEVAELPEELKNLDIAEYTRVYRFTKMVSDKNESVIDKMVTVLNAAYSSNATVITLISGHKDYTEYYLGVVSKDISQQNQMIETQGETFKGVLTGNFPGLEIEAISGENKKRLLKNIFVYDYVTSISGIASVRNEKDGSYEKFVQGIEHLVDSLQGREYTVVVIADPVNAQELAIAKTGYESLYTQLSPFLKTSISFNESDSVTLTQSHTEGVTHSVGESTSLTQNYAKTSGWSESFGQGSNENKESGHLIGSVAGAVVGIGATVLTAGAAAPAAAAIATAAFAGSSVGSQVGGGLIGSHGTNTNESASRSGSITESSGNTETKTSSEATQNSDTKSEAEGSTHGKTIQFSNENKQVKNLLNMIDKHIDRLQKCESYGAFNCATYVISSDPETNAIVSSGYNALMRGDNSSLQASQINNWNASDGKGRVVKDYLERFSHPLFVNPLNHDILLSPASVSNSYELAVNMGLPKKSINGLPVFEMASFGRNVYVTNQSSVSQKVKLGRIYHMGVVQNVEVGLDLKSLAMHTFVTGSTGSGKSNTVYQLLRELMRQGVRFLVIEPAKGEYKHVFGNNEAKVYGTNAGLSPLLKINPFRFPKEIHVLEHIDRLVEIFNVCWPMYAAMPAVLKDSVEKAYIKAGWNLSESQNKYSDELFPTFTDVLVELNNVVTESAFSQEVKDNYIGSLATRIKSLTNGLYGRIFANDELGDEALFDDNVIVDLSRVGSVETKSMIMGILVMRLQEYRMSCGEMNADLKHVTVLEEAHNLLKRTSTEQSGESANLLGKSVEMLSNAIAEVRTYGEGFIIADQAPGLLDMSVIRNTNTKIIMRLPDAEDRNLVGRSANLNDEQIKELAKIPTGVAAVYQNNWLEPVLCKVTYQNTESVYSYHDNHKEFLFDTRDRIILHLLNKVSGERLDLNMDQLCQEVIDAPLPTTQKTRILRILKTNGIVELKDISSIIYDIVATPELEKEADEAESIDEWKNTFLFADESVVANLDEISQNQIAECILREEIERFDKPNEYLETWYRYIKGEVM